MARNPIQMQKGMSLSELYRQYGTEAQCEAAVVAWRWPNGFECSRCGAREHAIVDKRRLFNCHGCQAQSRSRPTLFSNSTLLPLTKRFQGMYLRTQSKNSISGLELARQLGVRPDTASLIRHKLMSVMVERDAGIKLEGRVERDDAVLGGERSVLDSGKQGRRTGSTPAV
jgi:hypothetical protein